jgi:uncharacterized protein YhaN
LAPENATLKKIRKAIHLRDQAAVRIESSLIRLEILPMNEILIDTIAGEPVGETKAAANVKMRITGSPDVVVELKNIARLRATGPKSEIKSHRAEWEAACMQIDKLTRPYGTKDVEQLEAMAEEAAKLDRQVQESTKALEMLLGDRELANMKRQLVETLALEAGYLKSHPNWAQKSPDFSAMMRAVSDLRETHGKKIAAAHDHYTNLQAGYATAEEQAKALGHRIDEARKQVRQLDRALAELTTDGRKMHEREAVLHDILMDREGARNKLHNLKRKLDEYTDNPLEVLEKLERQLNGIREEALRARDEEMTTFGTLATLAAEGPYSAFTSAVEDINQLKEDIQREEMRVEAIRLLYETVNQCRSEAVAAVTEPVEASASRIFQRINGHRLRRIRVTDTFEPNQIQPGSTEAIVDLDNLSGGETEQLFLATRLALAEVLASKERQLVVIDDVLTATDSVRLVRALNVLEESARRLQILILTCHPERYRGLTDTQFFDLEALHRAADSL